MTKLSELFFFSAASYGLRAFLVSLFHVARLLVQDDMTVGELMADSTDISARRTGMRQGSDAGEGKDPCAFCVP
jgi:hypothetical protein